MEYIAPVIVAIIAFAGTVFGAYLSNRKSAALLTYRLEDQADIKTLAQSAKDTQLSVPYHPSGGQTCRLYTPQEIAGLYAIAQTHLTHHLTYSNQLKLYVKSLTTIEDIMKVSYGQELTGEFLNTYNMIMEQANKVIQKCIGIETGGATQ